jgi:hypothetical protein
MSWSLTRIGRPVAVVAVVLAAGCAHSDMRTPIAVQTVPALPILTAGQARGLTSVPWSSESSPGTGDTLMIRVAAVGCPQLRGTVVSETPAVVTLQVFAGTHRHCPVGDPGFIATAVRLPGPLGDRRLQHGPVGPPVPAIGNGPPARDIALRNRTDTH